MAMVAQPPQEQMLPYEYDRYQHAYPQQYPHAGHYPYVPPPTQLPTINIVVNINPNGHTNNQGHNNNHYGHPGTNQFHPATPQQQRHSYRQQLQQPQLLRSGPVVFNDDYNLPGFITRYANAKFFVIKSYNKEHVLSSIRHGVWTSTFRGNRKLNAAYSEAASVEQRAQSSTSSSNCPIFLLFSVMNFMSFPVILKNQF
jgi:hypothetical protein